MFLGRGRGGEGAEGEGQIREEQAKETERERIVPIITMAKRVPARCIEPGNELAGDGCGSRERDGVTVTHLHSHMLRLIGCGQSWTGREGKQRKKKKRKKKKPSQELILGRANLVSILACVPLCSRLFPPMRNKGKRRSLLVREMACVCKKRCRRVVASSVLASSLGRHWMPCCDARLDIPAPTCLT